MCARRAISRGKAACMVSAEPIMIHRLFHIQQKSKGRAYRWRLGFKNHRTATKSCLRSSRGFVQIMVSFKTMASFEPWHRYGGSTLPNRASRLFKSGIKFFLFREVVEHRYSEKYHEGSRNGVPKVLGIGEGVVEKHRRCRHKQAWNHGISPNLIGPGTVRLPAAKQEDGTGGDHVEKPFRID